MVFPQLQPLHPYLIHEINQSYSSMGVFVSYVDFDACRVRHFPQKQRHLTLPQRHGWLLCSRLHFLQRPFDNGIVECIITTNADILSRQLHETPNMLTTSANRLGSYPKHSRRVCESKCIEILLPRECSLCCSMAMIEPGWMKARASNPRRARQSWSETAWLWKRLGSSDGGGAG